MIISYIHTKGGTGKSTLSIQTAIALSLDEKTLLIDTDPQRTSSDALSSREDKKLHTVATTDIEKSLGNSFKHYLIDVAGRDSNSLRTSLLVSDICLIPVAPRAFELWALADLLKIVKEAKTITNFKVYAILNLAEPRQETNEQAIQFIKENFDIEVLSTIGRRSAIASASALGLSVIEYRPKDNKAIKEINTLIDRITSKLINN